MTQSAEIESSEKVIAPHKARLILVVGAVILLHAALLLFFWPHRWPAKYKWLLLPDAVGAYCLVALGVEHLKDNTKSEHREHRGTREGQRE